MLKTFREASQLAAFRYGRFMSKAKCQIHSAVAMIKPSLSLAETYLTKPLRIPLRLDMRKHLEITNMFRKSARVNQSLQRTSGRSDAFSQIMKTFPFQSTLASASGR